MIIKELRFVDPYDFPPDKVIKWKNEGKEVRAMVILRDNKTGKKWIDNTTIVCPERRGAGLYGKYGFLNNFPSREITHWCPIPEVE